VLDTIQQYPLPYFRRRAGKKNRMSFGDVHQGTKLLDRELINISEFLATVRD